jgi:uncharacterized lipoprotein YmbA
MKMRIMITALGLSLLIISGCVSKSAPNRFYTLNAIPKPEVKANVSEGEQCVAIGIGPVELPAYLDRPQIVVRTSANRFDFTEFDRWAEPLKDNFKRVLMENISTILCVEPIAVYPWRRSINVDYQVTVEVLHLYSDKERTAVLDAYWAVWKEHGKKVLVSKRSRFQQVANSKGYEAMVAAQSKTVEALCREIATALKKLSSS